jgi:hypothetical protein
MFKIVLLAILSNTVPPEEFNVESSVAISPVTSPFVGHQEEANMLNSFSN